MIALRDTAASERSTLQTRQMSIGRKIAGIASAQFMTVTAAHALSRAPLTSTSDRTRRERPMSEAIRFYLPFLLSAITIYMTVLAGNKSRNAWLFGLVNQALWLVWIIATASWGLLPMNLALWIVYGRNHLKWSRA
jgi:hypothetical protein